MIARSFDESAGIIRVKVTGSWNAAELDDHYEQLGVMIEAVRARSIPIRILVDVRDVALPSPGIEAQIAARGRSLYRQGDKVAILSADAGDKEHTRAHLDNVYKWAWQNEMAAEQWLLRPADDRKGS